MGGSAGVHGGSGKSEKKSPYVEGAYIGRLTLEVPVVGPKLWVKKGYHTFR